MVYSVIVDSQPDYVQISSYLCHPPLTGPLYTAPERLISAIEACNSPGPTLVNLIAPVGYGKTSLASAICRREGIPGFWITISSEDFDESEILEKLKLSATLAGVEIPDQGTILDYLASGARVRLCIDNIHLLSAGGISFILKLFSALSADSIMIICGDEDHALPLYQLRIDEQVVDLRTPELAARPAEVEAFFSKLGAPPDPEQLKIILRKTGGWWACLRLFSLTWNKQSAAQKSSFLKSFSATDRFIAEFLSSAIDSSLSEEQRELLVGTSICVSFCEELASRLTGLPAAAAHELILSLANRYLLTSYSHGWYRASVLLRQYYTATLDRENRNRLLTAAADWFSEKGMQKHAEHSRQHIRTSTVEAAASPLKKRELEILKLVALGLSNADIGCRLFISPGTVKWHMNNILQKLECTNRTGAVETARRKGFITSP